MIYNTLSKWAWGICPNSRIKLQGNYCPWFMSPLGRTNTRSHCAPSFWFYGCQGLDSWTVSPHKDCQWPLENVRNSTGISTGQVIPQCIATYLSRFVPSQWEMVLQCNDISQWLGASLGSALYHLLISCIPSCLTAYYYAQLYLIMSSSIVLERWFSQSCIQTHWTKGGINPKTVLQYLG